MSERKVMAWTDHDSGWRVEVYGPESVRLDHAPRVYKLLADLMRQLNRLTALTPRLRGPVSRKEGER